MKGIANQLSKAIVSERVTSGEQFLSLKVHYRAIYCDINRAKCMGHLPDMLCNMCMIKIMGSEGFKKLNYLFYFIINILFYNETNEPRFEVHFHIYKSKIILFADDIFD